MASNIFGLDIGRSFIKVAQVKFTGGKKYLEVAFSVQTPSGGIMNESAVELKKLSDSIKFCVNNAKISTDRCAVSLIESQVVSSLIQMPNLTDKELAAAINWEAEQYIPLPIKDVNLQYKVISRPSESSGQLDVLLIAAPKRIINKYLKIVKESGLIVEALETESSALTRALVKKEDPITILVSFGAISCELVVVREANVLFTRSIATGGINLTRAIMTEFNLPQNQAEEYKHTYGILEDKLSGKVAQVLKPILEILVSEILKAVEFTKIHVKDSSINRLVLCGGGAFLPGFSQFLTERTSMEVSLGDAWADFAKEGLILKIPGQGIVFSVATGLALRS